MQILLATSWGQPACGIQAHSEQLIAAVKGIDPTIEIVPSAEALDPAMIGQLPRFDVLHLNYHRALHSRWTPAVLRSCGGPIVITFHDTFGENPPDQLSQDLHATADAFVVHEPCEGLPNAIYLRQGVPPHPGLIGFSHKSHWSRPILGTAGFDFPWKNYGPMCRVAKAVGWGVLIYCPEMSQEREQELKDCNPWVEIRRSEDTEMIIAGLHECDATAFLYVCGNSGTSAAIRLGIAAGKPVIALETCRQFRDLLSDDLGNRVISWCDSFEEVQVDLRLMQMERFDAGIVALREQDSWEKVGQRYVDLYKQVSV